jgi:hypothetical protein
VDVAAEVSIGDAVVETTTRILPTPDEPHEEARSKAHNARINLFSIDGEITNSE